MPSLVACVTCDRPLSRQALACPNCRTPRRDCALCGEPVAPSQSYPLGLAFAHVSCLLARFHPPADYRCASCGVRSPYLQVEQIALGCPSCGSPAFGQSDTAPWLPSSMSQHTCGTCLQPILAAFQKAVYVQAPSITAELPRDPSDGLGYYRDVEISQFEWLHDFCAVATHRSPLPPPRETAALIAAAKKRREFQDRLTGFGIGLVLGPVVGWTAGKALSWVGLPFWPVAVAVTLAVVAFGLYNEGDFERIAGGSR